MRYVYRNASRISRQSGRGDSSRMAVKKARDVGLNVALQFGKAFVAEPLPSLVERYKKKSEEHQFDVPKLQVSEA